MLYLFRIEGFPDQPPIPQAQLRKLMGSDEQVLVLDVYCALAPKELMACVVAVRVNLFVFEHISWFHHSGKHVCNTVFHLTLGLGISIAFVICTGSAAKKCRGRSLA